MAKTRALEGHAVTGNEASRKLARHAATLTYEALPARLVELTKRCVLDTLGVIIGASGVAPEGRIVADYVKDFEGRPESTILGFGGKAPAPWAVFVNGSLAHMLDYDDLIDDSIGGAHTSIATVPAAFAVAEKAGGISGRELITAIVSGTDVMNRISQSTGIPYWTMSEGWFATQLLGFIAAAATAGRVLGLNEEQMENAFGIAFNQLSGSRQMAAGAATDLRAMQAGFSGQGGTLAAELARRGIVGSKEIIEGRYGLFKTYIANDEPQWDQMLGELGSRFPLLETHEFKVWPACSYTSPVNAAIQHLREELGLRAQDVEAITIVGGNDGTRLLCEPIEMKRRPQVSIDGKYSIPFTTAVMMVKGNVTLRDYTDQGLRDPTVLAMADRVSYRPDKNETSSAHGTSSVANPTVEIRTRDGRILVREPDGVPGDPTHPVSRELLENKFRDCISFSAKPIPAGNVDHAIEMIADLENLSDATEIIRLLS